MSATGLTVYGCEPDEEHAFRALAPRFGVVPTVTRAHVSERALVGMPHHRCVSVSHTSRVTAAVLRALHDRGVEHLSTRSIGVDHIDVDAARDLGITVANTAYAPDGVADFTVMLILMATRGVRHLTRHVTQHGGHETVRGTELRDLTVGVVGVGNIGTAVIERLRAFGCRVLACTNRPHPTMAAELVSLPDLLRASDVVTLHVPLTGDTRHLIGHAELATMRPGAILVNTARGALVDTDALVAALESGALGGAALDVVEGEDELCARDGRSVDQPALVRLQRLPNVIVTPHVAYATRGVLHETVEHTLTQALNFERSRARAETQDRDRVRRLLGGA